MNKIQKLKDEGYTIAIDDFIEDYQYTSLVDLCSIIKVEFMGGATRQSIENIVRTWKPRGKLLLAEKVETMEEFEWAKGVGFDFFQGYFFSKPSMVRSKGLKDSASQYIRLMNELNVPEPVYKHIASIIEMDVALTYKILKLVNSKILHNKISSIQHALSIIGVKAIKRWLSLAMVQNLSTPEKSELVITSMVRSHLLEDIANNSSMKTHIQELTLIGVLSILDVILEKPMEDLMASLPLTDAVKDTLLGKETLYSIPYKLCLCYERGDFEELDNLANSINYDVSLLPKNYIDSVKWADHTFAFMQNDL